MAHWPPSAGLAMYFSLQRKLFVNDNQLLKVCFVFNRCVSNCGFNARKVTADQRVVVGSVCEGPGCEAISGYRWNLFLKEKHNWKKVNNLQEMASTTLNGPTLVLSGSPSLRSPGDYKVVVNVFMKDKTTEQRQSLFRTNSPPGGSTESKCYVSPQKGQPVVDDFFFKCEGYTDEDLPLNYQFSMSSSVGLVFFQSSLSPNTSVRLPLGDPNNNYSMFVNVDITDAYGAGIQIPVNVKVEYNTTCSSH